MIESVRQLFADRGGTDTYEKRRTYSRMFEVITDDEADDEQVVGNADGIPVLGTALDGDSDAVVVSVSCRQSDDTPLIWYVSVEYDTEPPKPGEIGGDRDVDFDGNPIDRGGTGGGQPFDNPLLEPATWSITFQDTEEPAIEGVLVEPDGTPRIEAPSANWATDTAYKRGAYVQNGGNVYLCVAVGDDGKSAPAGAGPSGKGTQIEDDALTWDFYATLAETKNDLNKAIRVAITTSGKLPFDPPVMVTVSKPVLTVTKNLPLGLVTLAYLMALKNAVNEFGWRGLPARCAKVLKIDHDGGKERNGIPYVTTKWEIGLDVDTWDVRVLDAGFGYMRTRTEVGLGQVTKYVRFTDEQGNPLEQPVPLNGAGQPLEPGDPPVYRRFIPRQTRVIDFGTALPF
jgi:hypothetical protein